MKFAPPAAMLGAVDNQTRQSNVIIHGVREGNPLAEAIKFLKTDEQSSKVVQTAHFVGNKNVNGTCPLLVNFATTKAKNNFITCSRGGNLQGC